MTQIQSREQWVDNVKLFACILVTLGHFFQSMVNSSILPETFLYSWFNRTIYFFHVPLFFLCSGYLYQKKAEKKRRGAFLMQKGIALLVPYVAFPTLSWLLKEVFAGSVNRQNAGFLHTLLVKPLSPYWYLYTLLFIFLVVPRFAGKKEAAYGGICAVCLKGLRVLGNVETGIYAVDGVMDNMIWFVLGMLLCLVPERMIWDMAKRKVLGGISAGVFLAESLWISAADFQLSLIDPIMGIWGCVTVVLLMRYCSVGGSVCSMAKLLSSYTMPIFLMHTIFAAGFRAVLLKIGIITPIIHVVLGVIVSFAGPIMAAMVMEKLKLDFLMYPGKYFVKVKHKESQDD